MQVNLIPATSDKQKQIVRNFFVPYYYALTEYDALILINEYGIPTWGPQGLPGPTNFTELYETNQWVREKCEQYIIEVDGVPAGFVILCAVKEVLIPNVDIELLDFFVAPKYRRQKVGYIAAQAAFDLHHARWEVFHLAGNAPARAFWKKVIADYTHNNFQSQTDERGTHELFAN